MRAGSGVVLENSSVTWPSHSGSKGVTLTMIPHLAYVELCTMRSLATKLCSFGTEISKTSSSPAGSMLSTTSHIGPSSRGLKYKSPVASATLRASKYDADWADDI